MLADTHTHMHPIAIVCMWSVKEWERLNTCIGRQGAPEYFVLDT
jgi:hypothetical protein